MEKGARHRQNAGSGRPSLLWLLFLLSSAVRIALMPPRRLIIEVAMVGRVRCRCLVPPADKAEDIASTHHGDAGESSRSDER